MLPSRLGFLRAALTSNPKVVGSVPASRVLCPRFFSIASHERKKKKAAKAGVTFEDSRKDKKTKQEELKHRELQRKFGVLEEAEEEKVGRKRRAGGEGDMQADELKGLFEKSVEFYQSRIEEVSIQQPTVDMFDHVKVEGQRLVDIAQVSMQNATTANFNVFDESMAQKVRAALQKMSPTYAINVESKNRLQLTMPRVTAQLKAKKKNEVVSITNKAKKDLQAKRAIAMKKISENCLTKQEEYPLTVALDKMLKNFQNQVDRLHKAKIAELESSEG